MVPGYTVSYPSVETGIAKLASFFFLLAILSSSNRSQPPGLQC